MDEEFYIRMDGGGFMPWFAYTLVVNEQEFNLGHHLDGIDVRQLIHEKAVTILNENNIAVRELDFRYGQMHL